MNNKVISKKIKETRTEYDVKQYEKFGKKKLVEIITDLEDTIDLLKAERESTGFTPYEKFRIQLKEKGKL